MNEKFNSEMDKIDAECDIISNYAEAIEVLKTIANLENVNTYVQLDENVKMAVNFYAREFLEKLSIPY